MIEAVKPTLGQMVRALRLGYGWTGYSFMRISGDCPFMVEMYPVGLIPNSEKNGRMHWVWWGDGNGQRSDILSSLPLAKVKAKRKFICYIDDNGEPV